MTVPSGAWRAMVVMNQLYEHVRAGRYLMAHHPAPVWHPATDVFECDIGFLIKAAISGLRRQPNGVVEDAEVVVENDTVILRGCRLDRCAHTRRQAYHIEIPYGRFEIRVRFAVPFSSEHVRAEYRDGFLEVFVPKTESAASGTRRIEVRTEA